MEAWMCGRVEFVFWLSGACLWAQSSNALGKGGARALAPALEKMTQMSDLRLVRTGARGLCGWKRGREVVCGRAGVWLACVRSCEVTEMQGLGMGEGGQGRVVCCPRAVRLRSGRRG
eukprot:1209879-Rhodomonas_salina.1